MLFVSLQNMQKHIYYILFRGAGINLESGGGGCGGGGGRGGGGGGGATL